MMCVERLMAPATAVVLILAVVASASPALAESTPIPLDQIPTREPLGPGIPVPATTRTPVTPTPVPTPVAVPLNVDRDPADQDLPDGDRELLDTVAAWASILTLVIAALAATWVWIVPWVFKKYRA